MGKKKNKSRKRNRRELFLNEDSLAHDIRALNQQLKSYTESIAEVFKKNRNVLGREEAKIHSAKELTNMITNRLDIYDFYKNKGMINTRESHSSLHRIVTKVVRILSDRSEKKDLKVLIGDSQFEFHCSTKFYTALFVVLENCIKYSPQGGKIDISISQNEHHITIEFNNMGPQLINDEISQVFEYGFRGSNAKKHTKSGSGIGMHYAREMCNLHFFNIELFQKKSDSISAKGTNYSNTTTRISIPVRL